MLGLVLVTTLHNLTLFTARSRLHWWPFAMVDWDLKTDWQPDYSTNAQKQTEN